MAWPPPSHVNQFSARGTFPNGTSSAAYDCTVASGVMALDAATGGRLRLTTTQLRAKQDDQDRNGIGLDDLKTAYGRTPGAPAFEQGNKTWGTVAARLRNGEGAILQGYAVALGSSRASSFRGAHAVYAQRIMERPSGAEVARINDPLRYNAVDIPLRDLQAFYLSGIGRAGWAAGAVSTPVPAPAVVPLPVPNTFEGWQAQLARLGIATDPAHVITAAEAERIVTALYGTKGSVYARSVQHFTGKTVQAAWNGGATAMVPNAIDDAAAAVTAWVGELVRGLSEIGRNALLLVAILGLVIMGLWLVATATDNPLPSPPRIPIGA